MKGVLATFLQSLLINIPTIRFFIVIFSVWFLPTDKLSGSNLQQENNLPPITITTDERVIEHILEAQVLIDLGKYDKSIAYLHHISNQYKGNNSEIEARLLGGLARNYLKIGFYEEAIKYWDEAIELTEGIDNDNYLPAIFYNNKALAYLKMNQPNKARNSLERALTLYPIAETYQKLSKIAIDYESDYELSKSYLDAGLKFLNNQNDFRVYGKALNSNYLKELGHAYLLEGSDAQVELEKLITVMEEYPTLKIEIRSHTDSRGSERYNNQLSERRAQSTMQYLIENGIEKNRLKAKGYGETKLLNECKDEVPCSKTKHEQNRRSEFIILE